MSAQSSKRLALALALAAVPLSALLPGGLSAQAPLAPAAVGVTNPVTIEPAAVKRGETPAPSARRPVRRERDRLAPDEIGSAAHADLLSLIRAERPLWLSTRGQTSPMLKDVVRVYYGGILLGGPEVLERMNPGGIREIVHLDSRDATMRYGKNHNRGAILLVPGT